MISLEELLSAPLLPKNLPPFEIIKDCQKGEESLNDSDDSEGENSDEVEEVFPCECGYDENSSNFEGQACGSTANCINRELFIECNAEECPCRNRCQNQRFQKRQYSNVKVIETPGKGFGLFTCEDLKPGTLVMEYVGEIVNQEQMGRRAEKYSKRGQQHFYFMTLRPNQIIDATCKGNLSRFMNHSCAPNCETQKWIVGGKIKIGLFTLKSIKAGSELTFDYKFVRFGKEPQKCLCGEPTCTGFIGVSASESNKTGRKRIESNEEEEEEVDEFEIFMETNPIQAELPGQISLIVTKLIQTDDLNLIKKLLKILESSQKYLCQRKFLNLHGLKLLSTLYAEHPKDQELILSILRILKELPLNTKNIIEDSGWNEKLQLIKEGNGDNEIIFKLTQELEEKWDNLEKVFRIPKIVRSNEKSSEDVNSTNNNVTSSIPTLMSVPSEFSSALQRKRQQFTFDEDDKKSPRSRSEFKSPRQSSPETSRSRSPVKKAPEMIPDPMWLAAKAPDGRTYYYHSVTRDTTWEVPLIPNDHRNNRDGGKGDYRNNNRDASSHRQHGERDNRHSRDSRIDSRQGDYDYKDRHRSRDDRRDDRYHRDRDHRDCRDRESGHYRDRESRDNRDRKDRDSQSYSRPQEQTHSQNANSALIEGISDSSQIAAIIERAKVRRNQEQDEASGESHVEVLSPFTPTDSSALNDSSKKYYAKLKEEVSGVVIRFFSHYRKDLGDDFKELARKYTHKIIEKELKETSAPMTINGDAPILTSKKKQKIKIYLAEVIKGRKIKLSSEHESILGNKQQ